MKLSPLNHFFQDTLGVVMRAATGKPDPWTKQEQRLTMAKTNAKPTKSR
jgi:hypothetical protein